jgi:RNA polymerase sigma-70 factor (ECF subfamily)
MAFIRGTMLSPSTRHVGESGLLQPSQGAVDTYPDTMEFGEQFTSVLEAARAGSEWALGALYENLHPSVLGYLRTRDAGEAEDLASETWVGVAEGLSGFHGGESDFRRWVFTIARRRLIDHQRRTVRRATTPAPPETLEGHTPFGDAEADAMAELSTQAALALIGTLPSDQADVVLLRVLGGFDAAEVGSIMRKRPGTVRVLQHRALVQLAKTLSREAVTG